MTVIDDARPIPIRAKVEAGQRLSFDDAVTLYRTGDILSLGYLANLVRERMHGDATYFNVNRHINPTDVCVVLQVEKRGRFITNMGFANFVTAAVESDDPRIKGTCMVILEETDPGTFDRGTPTRKLVHQLSSTNDPVLSLQVPAHRIIGGYSVKDGVIVPRYSHGEIIEAVFRRTRVTVAIMTSAKLLSAVE